MNFGVFRKESCRRIVFKVFAGLGALLLVCNAALAQSDASANLEDLRRTVERQQEIIETQQRRLDALETKLVEAAAENSSAKEEIALTAGAATEKETEADNSNRKDSKALEIRREGFSAKIYGFLRMDMAANTDRMSFDNQLPFYVMSPADPSQAGARTGSLTFHPRLTRLGLEFTIPGLPAGWKGSGRVETDFFGAVIDRQSSGVRPRDLVSNSRAVLRLRLAYVEIEKGSLRILAGQNWDVISPIVPSYNSETAMWNGGNTGDRRPQFRVTYEPRFGKGRLSLAAAIGASGAVDGQDLDGDGFSDGESSGAPTKQFRIGYSLPLKKSILSFGVWAHDASQQLNRSEIAGRGKFKSSLVGMDFNAPVSKRVTVRGEFWTGKGLSDVRGGIGQSVNAQTGQVIASSGGWTEALFRVNSHYTAGVGTSLDNPRSSDITTAGGRTRNQVYYVTNRFHVGNGLMLGFDYGRWETRYKELPKGANNRFNLFVQQSF